MRDNSTNGLHGTMTNGGSNVTGKFNRAIEFDGVNDYIAVTDPGAGSVLDFTTGDSQTVSFWMKLDAYSDSSNFSLLFTKGATGGVATSLPNYSVEVYGSAAEAGILSLNFRDAGNTVWVEYRLPIGSVRLEKWTHVAYTFTYGTSTSIKMYIDGVEQTGGWWNTGTGNEAPYVSNEALWIGGSNFNGGVAVDYPTDGRIDEFMMFRRILTATEIANLYKRGALELQFQVRSCDDAACSGETFVGPDGTAGTYFTELLNTGFVTPQYGFPSNLLPNRYFQYRATFETTDSTYRPELLKVQVRSN